MYDFANSGYTTVVITAVFSAYFVSVISANRPWATFAWTAALSRLVPAHPGRPARWSAHGPTRTRAKKRVLLACTVGCVVFTARSLYFVEPGQVALALLLIVLSNYFFGTGENLIAAFLPELADSRAIGRVSGWGWAFGYCGGLLALGLCLAYLLASGRPAAEAVPVTMLDHGGFLRARGNAHVPLPARARRAPAALGTSVAAGEADTDGIASDTRICAASSLCIVFYQAGITAVISLAAIYAEQVMKFTMQQTITLILVVNVTAAIGAFGFGYVQDAIGHVRALALTLVGWIVMVLIAGTTETIAGFWVAANLAGLCMGSSQAAGRAIVGYLAPPARLAEFFGLWGLAVKAASIFGPLTYGVITWVFAGNHRLGIFSTGVYFVLGLALLKGIDIQRGRRQALSGA